MPLVRPLLVLRSCWILSLSWALQKGSTFSGRTSPLGVASSLCFTPPMPPNREAPYLATAALRTWVRKNPPLVRSITCWYTELGGWFMTTVPSL